MRLGKYVYEMLPDRWYDAVMSTPGINVAFLYNEFCYMTAVTCCTPGEDRVCLSLMHVYNAHGKVTGPRWRTHGSCPQHEFNKDYAYDRSRESGIWIRSKDFRTFKWLMKNA